MAKRISKRTFFFILRGLAILFLLLALIDLRLNRISDNVHFIFLADLSSSMKREMQGPGREFIETALQKLKANDKADILYFGGKTTVGNINNLDNMTEKEPVLDIDNTNIENALLAATSLFDEGSHKKIVLMTDGNETTGTAESAARIASTLGVEIAAVPFSPAGAEAEIIIQGIVVPPSIQVASPHQVRVLVESNIETSAVLTFLADSVYVGEDTIELTPGKNSFAYTSSVETPGLHSYEVFISADTDGNNRNNYYETLFTVEGEPEILYVYGPEGPSQNALNALASQRIKTVVADAYEMPESLLALATYEALILDDVPAVDLTFQQMEMIESYVKNTGGGLLMTGGDNSFGAGGYYKTAVEQALPVNMDVTSSKGSPSLSMIMVIDKSGSMQGETSNSISKLDIVKEAVLSATEILEPFYLVGLLAFDASFEWTVPLVNAGDRQNILQGLSSLVSGGDTDLFPALEEAYRELSMSGSAIKHVLVLTDGLTKEDDFEELVRDMQQDGITISTIAVGNNSNNELLESIALWGGGRYYFTDRIENTPRIFASESIIVSRDLTVEESFLPSIDTPHPAISGLTGDTAGLDFGFPMLHGFTLTYTKTGADQVLTTFMNNPLLAVWRYGAGHSAAFTTDIRLRWARDWVRWEKFPVFLAQLLRSIKRPDSSDLLQSTVSISGNMGKLRLYGQQKNGEYLNNRNIVARLVTPQLEDMELQLIQTGPGEYEAPFQANDIGQYMVSVEDKEDSLFHSTGISIPYPAEIGKFQPNSPLLRKLAAITGGDIYSPLQSPPAKFFDRTPFLNPSGSLRKEMLLIALLLFLADILIRLIPDKKKLKEILQSRKGESKSYAEVIQSLDEEKKTELKEKASYWFEEKREKTVTDSLVYLAKKRQERQKN